MDPITIQAVKDVGFPIVAYMLAAFALGGLGRWAIRRADRLLDDIENRSKANDERLDAIEPKLDKIIDTQPRVCRMGPAHE